MKFGKRGSTLSNFIFAIVAVLFVFVIGTAVYQTTVKGNDFVSSLSDSIDTVGSVLSLFKPVFDALLGTANSENSFLMIITFILISIIVVATLDSVNIFGDNQQGQLVNFAVGIITSIIGVRFMPSNMWQSLTAPSSAFVATILMGIPFGALFVVTMKIKSSLARKAIWMFFVIFLSYLMFFPDQIAGGMGGTSDENDFAWIYGIFLIASIFMLLGEGLVRRFMFKQSAAASFRNTLGLVNTEELIRIEGRITKLMDERGKTRSARLQATLDDEIDNLKKDWERISGEVYT